MIGDNAGEKFENVMIACTCLGIMGVLLMLYAFLQTPRPMKEPEVLTTEHRIKIAIIDTGLQLSSEIKPYLCKQGHYSLVDSSPLVDDSTVKHGTNVAGLIAQNLNPHRECLLIIKMVHPYVNEWEWSALIVKSLDYAFRQNAKFVNLSLGGPKPSIEEFERFKVGVRNGINFSVAAGNFRGNFDKTCNYFPACYAEKLSEGHFHVVGSSTGDYSNQGKLIKFFEDGTGKGGPIPLAGTSQATAIHTGKWVRSLAK